MSKPVDESFIGTLVRTLGRTASSPTVRQTARTAALGAGATAAWRGTQGNNPSSRTPNRTPPGNDTWSRMVGVESGGRQFNRAGQTLTSPKGAIGAAQIMPQYGAEFARRAGVEWDERRARTDREYNLSLGRAQFDHLVRRYRGDHARAAAAYNAGPGGLARAERRARAAGRPDNWRYYLPAETRNYVGRVVHEDTSGQYLSKRDVINRVVETYSVQPEEPVTLQEMFIEHVETLKESHAMFLLRLFNDLSEDNQEVMFDMVQTEEGVRELLDFAIDKYMVSKN